MTGFASDGLARNFLAGQWREGDGGQRLAVEDPATLDTVADAALAGEQTLARALETARACFERGDLADMRPAARVAMLHRIAREIRAIADEGGLFRGDRLRVRRLRL